MDIYYKDLPLDHPRDYLITDLINIADRDFKYFDKAISAAIIECNRDIEIHTKNNRDYIAKNHTDENGEILPYHLSDLPDLWSLHHVENQLLSLIEMKVIYFYKSLENAIKDLIVRAYPDDLIADTYKFNNILIFFKKKNINLKTIVGYDSFNKIRILNNNIKHHTSPNADFLSEIDDNNTYTVESLGAEYSVNTDNSIKFIEKLKDFIINDLFEYDDEKIEKIASDIAFKMRYESLEKLIIKLKES